MSFLETGTIKGLWHGTETEFSIRLVSSDGSFDGTARMLAAPHTGTTFKFTGTVGIDGSISIERADAKQKADAGSPQFVQAQLRWEGTTSGDGIPNAGLPFMLFGIPFLVLGRLDGKWHGHAARVDVLVINDDNSFAGIVTIQEAPHQGTLFSFGGTIASNGSLVLKRNTGTGTQTAQAGTPEFARNRRFVWIGITEGDGIPEPGLPFELHAAPFLDLGTFSGEWHGDPLLLILKPRDERSFDGHAKLTAGRHAGTEFSVEGTLTEDGSIRLTRRTPAGHQTAEAGPPQFIDNGFVWRGNTSGDGIPPEGLPFLLHDYTPAKPTGTLGFAAGHILEIRRLRPGETMSVEFRGVGPGMLKISADTLKRESIFVEDDRPHKGKHGREINVPDQPVFFSLSPSEGSGQSISGIGSGEAVAFEDNGGPDHLWKCVFQNTTGEPARVRGSVTYVSRDTIERKAISMIAVNDVGFDAVLQLGPSHAGGPADPNVPGGPPLQLIIGEKMRVVFRKDWAKFLGDLDISMDLPIPFLKEIKSLRPVVSLQPENGQPVLVLELSFEENGVELGSSILGADLQDLRVRIKFYLRAEAQMIVPYCAIETDIKVELANKWVLGTIAAIGSTYPLVGFVAGIFGLGLGSDALTDTLRNLLRFDVASAINARRYELAKWFTRFIVGANHPVSELSVDGGNMVVVYAKDEVRPLPTLPPGPPKGNLDPIKHIVVLMLENRSFDHMLGYLRREKGRDDIDGLAPPGEGEPRNYLGNRAVRPQPLKSTLITVEPAHSLDSVAAQIGQNRDMSGFVENFALRIKSVGGTASPDEIMGYHQAHHVWAYNQLAEHFMICDKWFSSHPGPTFPNRFFTMAGHLGTGEQGGPDALMTGGAAPIKLTTIFDELTIRGVGWAYFEHDVAALRRVEQFTTDFINIRKIRDPRHGFFVRAAAGTLPSVVFIDPNFSDVPDGPPNDDHPLTGDIRGGQMLVADIYHALRMSPNWNETLFIITYDEHGGFFDHVTPPPAPVVAGGAATFGVRVPAILVSPLVRPGSVSHEHYDHTSIIKTIVRCFCNENPPDFGERVQAARDLESCLSNDPARTDVPYRLTPPAEPVHQPQAAPSVVHDGPSVPRDPTDFKTVMSALRASVDARRPPD